MRAFFCIYEHMLKLNCGHVCIIRPTFLCLRYKNYCTLRWRELQNYRRASGAEREYSFWKPEVEHDVAWWPNGRRPLRARLCAHPDISPESNSMQTLQTSINETINQGPRVCDLCAYMYVIFLYVIFVHIHICTKVIYIYMHKDHIRTVTIL